MRVCGGVGGWGIPRVLSALRAATDVRNDKVSASRAGSICEALNTNSRLLCSLRL